MTLDLLDLLLIAKFCFDKPVPWWLWGLGAMATLASNQTLRFFNKKI